MVTSRTIKRQNENCSASDGWGTPTITIHHRYQSPLSIIAIDQCDSRIFAALSVRTEYFVVNFRLGEQLGYNRNHQRFE
jgi:hypothetical protein